MFTAKFKMYLPFQIILASIRKFPMQVVKRTIPGLILAFTQFQEHSNLD